MDIKEVVISAFAKDFGTCKLTENTIDGKIECYLFEFLYKINISLKILVLEADKNDWVIHYESSKENPILLKKLVRVCDRVKSIIENDKITVSLSDDLLDIKNDLLLKIMIRSSLQNFLAKHFVLFGSKKAKNNVIFSNAVEINTEKEKMLT